MDKEATHRPARNRSATYKDGEHSMLVGIEVRAEDVEEERGLHIAGYAFRIATVLIILFAGYQAYEWLRDPPPGGVGVSVLISDTVRLLITAILLYGAADLADLFVKSHREQRASRILLARQTYLMRQTGVARGIIPSVDAAGDRRGLRQFVAPRLDEPTTPA